MLDSGATKEDAVKPVSITRHLVRPTPLHLAKHARPALTPPAHHQRPPTHQRYTWCYTCLTPCVTPLTSPRTSPPGSAWIHGYFRIL
jgi:hypothetical protein